MWQKPVTQCQTKNDSTQGKHAESGESDASRYVKCYNIIGICSRMLFVAQMSPRSAEGVRVLEEALYRNS
ncbi:hypothetical protein Q1695_000515 [Nippostrongylus brasiliensis]|nr:hypothetical protein Q1695_000515 [Nippostrongylus brasiliensis]